MFVTYVKTAAMCFVAVNGGCGCLLRKGNVSLKVSIKQVLSPAHQTSAFSTKGALCSLAVLHKGLKYLQYELSMSVSHD